MANAARLSLLERIDAWNMTIWEIVYLGRYEEALRTYGEARKALRAGEPEYMLAHGAAWAAYAAMLCGSWDDALVLGDTLLAMREESHGIVGRFTFPGWVGAMRAAAARLDTARLARYRSAFTAIGEPEQLPEPNRSLWVAFIGRDAEAARRVLIAPSGPNRDRKGETLAMLLLDLGERVREDDLATLERQAPHDPPVVELRIKLARALNDGVGELRHAIAALDEGHLVADAARAAALLALRTKDADDRADAQRRLGALGDRAYLQRLAED